MPRLESTQAAARSERKEPKCLREPQAFWRATPHGSGSPRVASDLGTGQARSLRLCQWGGLVWRRCCIRGWVRRPLHARCTPAFCAVLTLAAPHARTGDAGLGRQEAAEQTEALQKTQDTLKKKVRARLYHIRTARAPLGQPRL